MADRLSLSSLDVEILRFVLRFQLARPHHVAAWTGAGVWWVRDRVQDLVRVGLLRRLSVAVDLRDGSGRIRETVAHVLEATAAGADRAGEWAVPGTETDANPEGVPISLPARRPSSLTTHHVLGVADVACWYRTYGFKVAAEREIRSLEQTGNLKGARPAISAWSVAIPGKPGIHPPDLGAVDPNGGMWAVELERATKPVADYTGIIGAYQAAGLGQIWHVLSSASGRRLMDAANRNGIVWGAQLQAVAASHDGLVRFQGWVPGRAGLTGPASWRNQVPGQPPAGLPFAHRPDLTVHWRKGIPKNVDGVLLGDSSGIWA